METAIQVASVFGAVATIILGIIAIWLSLYFYRRNNELYTGLGNIISRIEASSRVTEVASKDIIRPIVETVREIFQSSARERVDILRSTVIQRLAASLDEALKELPEEQRRKAREAVYKEIDAFVGTLKEKIEVRPLEPKGETIAPAAERIPERQQTIPGSKFYNWMPFIRRIRDLEDTHRFLSVKWLRGKKFASDIEMQEALQLALEREMLLTYYVDNTKNPLFPTLACKLNREHFVVREILQSIG